MNIDEMEAGRELDALIAENVLGYECDCSEGPKSDCPIHGRQPYSLERYSTDIAAAWQVVEHLNKSGLIINITVALPINEMFQYSVTIPGFDIKYAKTIPLAVCRAALKTVVSP